MAQQSSLSIFAVLVVVTAVCACAPQEHIEPLYEPKDYEVENIVLNIPTTINIEDAIQPTGIRRFIYKIPLLNKLLAIPLDITNTLIPKIPLLNDVEDFKDDPDFGMWADPEFLRLVKSLTITKGWLRQKSDEEVSAEGHDLGSKRSWLCQSKGISFIKNMKAKLLYKNHARPHAEQETIPLAYTNNSSKYFRNFEKILPNGKKVQTKMFTFEIIPQELIDYVQDVNDFKVKLEADGRIPCETVFLEAGLEVRVVLNLKK